MTHIVGILNITPDSFSDGGMFIEAKNAIAHLEALLEEGADMVDIGAESTRPGATPISAEEEWQRLQPFFDLLTPEHTRYGLSLDTRHAANAKRALDKGFIAINDVSGFSDTAMIEVIKPAAARLVVMHSLGVPADKNIVLAEDVDVIATLQAWWQKKEKHLAERGIARERLIFDPGIGFGKNAAQSRAILERIGELQMLGVPLYIGHSRKSFLGDNRDAATLDRSKKLMQAGVEYVRVHDVAVHVALREALML